MEKISVLGSTGFIGSNTLEIIAEFPDRFKVAGLAAGKNIDLLLKQIQVFKPDLVSVDNKGLAEKLESLLPATPSTEILFGQDGMERVATHPEAGLVVSSMVGSIGLAPTMAAIQSGKRVALANKETLVVAGRLIMEAARSNGVEILPIDSEHSAVFQALQGHRRADIRRIILTASGGPFLNLDSKDLLKVTPEEALKHPTWEMGKKITIDSATMMNKGLEVIEARWLFDISPEKIEVVIHPQSIIHSMVEYCDGSTIAQMSVPDMKIPISYALVYPERSKNTLPSLSLAEVGQLSFMQPDEERFPALRLSYQALQEEESMATVLNGANEAAVGAFLQNRLSFSNIPLVVARTMDLHTPRKLNDVEESLEINAWAGQEAGQIIAGMT
ncbi:MAG: 1-deoxy-D-xylulose-5-phosphate reductoisomerase [Proteobacteria bacterium]|nr:1-deoxy-D-xylulose-5-phosphate reductoisomerase [Pseudomonadota bacterium]